MATTADQEQATTNKILLVKGQGIGPECIEATKKVLAATGVPIEYSEGSLGYPDAKDLFENLQAKNPDAYAKQFGSEEPYAVAARLEKEAKDDALSGGNVNDFYKKLLAKLDKDTLTAVKAMVTELEKETLAKAAASSAVLKGALRTLDEGDEPSRNVTVRKMFEQYANIRRCVTLDPIAPGAKGADILFVRENVEDLYAAIEHRLGRNYTQALRHQTPEGCELICRAAFEAALRDGRKKVTALEKPNILKITGGMFKEVFLKVAKDYPGIEANFQIIDDGLAAIAANPEKYDVVVTTNMFGDIGSDVAAKVTGGVGLVSSNNTNPNNPKAVSMFETMGGTADDIAGQNKANPVALIDAAAEMLLHIGGKDNIIAAELIKTAILEVLADGYYVGDVKKGPYQEAKGKEKLGTQEFAEKVAEKVAELKVLKEQRPDTSIKELAIERAQDGEVKSLFERVLRSYEQYAKDMEPGSQTWVDFVKRNTPPNPTRSQSEIVGFDLFVDNSGMVPAFDASGAVDESRTQLDAKTKQIFESGTEIDISGLFNEGKAGSVQSVRSFGQFSAKAMRDFLGKHADKATVGFGQLLRDIGLEKMADRFSDSLKQNNAENAITQLEKFDEKSIELVQAFYKARAAEIEPILEKHGFKLARITSRGTEIFPTMGDFEKRDVDHFRVEIDPKGKLAHHNHEMETVQTEMLKVQEELVASGWIISESTLNRNFMDGEGPHTDKITKGASKAYGAGLGKSYARVASFCLIAWIHSFPMLWSMASAKWRF